MLRACLLLLLFSFPCYARLGDTLGQLQDRYGLQKEGKNVKPAGAPLMLGAKEFTFEFEGFRIRCALLKATDGEHYCVRQQYERLASAQPNASAAIRDFEIDAILAAEAGARKWSEKQTAVLSLDPLQRLVNEWITKYQVKGRVWVREDGALASVPTPATVRLELPLASQYEDDFKKFREAEERAKVPQF